jgi:hypothetical protein
VLTRENGRSADRHYENGSQGKPLPLDAGLVDVLTAWHGVCRLRPDRDYSFANPVKDRTQSYWPHGGIGRSHPASGTPDTPHAKVSITTDRYVQAVTPARREAYEARFRSQRRLRKGNCSHTSQIVDGNGCNCLNEKAWALNSAVECHLHTLTIGPPAVDYKEVR